MSSSQSTISRRTLAKGVGWTVPTVLVAGAAPAYAASPCDPITDIDAKTYDYAVAVTSSTSYSYAIRSTTHMKGNGTVADSFRPYVLESPVDDWRDTGNVRLSFTGAVTSFDVTYWNQADSVPPTGQPVDGDQAIFFTDFTFSYRPC